MVSSEAKLIGKQGEVDLKLVKGTSGRREAVEHTKISSPKRISCGMCGTTYDYICGNKKADKIYAKGILDNTTIPLISKWHVLSFIKKEKLKQKHFHEGLLAVTHVTAVGNRRVSTIHILFRRNGKKYFAELYRDSKRYNLTQVSCLG